MALEKHPRDISVIEAMDYLSALAEIDESVLLEDTSKGKTEKEKLDARISRASALRILSEDGEDSVKQTFKTLHNYLKNVSREKEQLKDPETFKAIESIMVLAHDAAERVDRFSGISQRVFQGKKIADLKEYKDLKAFYQNKIVKRFERALEQEVQDLVGDIPMLADSSDIHRRGLKDLETVRRDKDYELFYILAEDGKAFFNRNLIRHIRLLGYFDENVVHSQEDDPFLKFHQIYDTMLCKSAQFIKQSLIEDMNDFFQHYSSEVLSAWDMALSKAMIALCMAASPQNLSLITLGKSCRQYFFDFHHYLREALYSVEYQNALVKCESEKERHLLRLTSQLCLYFFARPSQFTESADLIQRIVQKGAKLLERTSAIIQTPLDIWRILLDDDENIRAFLKLFPSGPLLKIVEEFEEQVIGLGFDPISQHLLVGELYAIRTKGMDISCLHLPSPTRQEVIQEASIVPEFINFLKTNTLGKKKHLLVDFQDSTSWRGHARSAAITALQEKGDTSAYIRVLSLPKHTPFYYQTEEYNGVSNAQNFKDVFLAQIESGQACGFGLFHFTKIEKAWMKQSLDLIHECFFQSKTDLTRKMRLDFIEIFYLFITLEQIFKERVDSFSFTCKDASDLGPVASASFYAFIQLLSSKGNIHADSRGTILQMIYTPAFLLRERPIDETILYRHISALATIHFALSENEKGIKTTLHKHFAGLLDNIEINRNLA